MALEKFLVVNLITDSVDKTKMAFEKNCWERFLYAFLDKGNLMLSTELIM